jgi:hypothetical protein
MYSAIIERIQVLEFKFSEEDYQHWYEDNTGGSKADYVEWITQKFVDDNEPWTTSGVFTIGIIDPSGDGE